MSGAVIHGLANASENAETENTEKSGVVLPERQDSKIDNGHNNSEFSKQSSSAIEEGAALNNDAAAQNAAALHGLDTAVAHTHLSHHSAKNSPILHIETQHIGSSAHAVMSRLREPPTIFETTVPEDTVMQHSVTSPSALPLMESSLRSNLSTSSMASTVSQGSGSLMTSPYLSAMSDLTPLPSPLTASDSSLPRPWRTSLGRSSITSRPRGGSVEDPAPGEHISPQTSPPSASKKRKGYGNLLQDAVEANAVAAGENSRTSTDTGHGRSRSISDFVPEHLQNFRQRHVTFGPGDGASLEAQEHRLQREAHLAARRGLTLPAGTNLQHQLPSPPTSTSSVGESDGADDDASASDYLVIHCGVHNKRRKFRQLRQLGEGTFSRVVLATSERIPAHPTPEIEEHLDPHKLVAVKIVQQGPAGGADEQRIETGLKREVEMLKSLSHPSLIHLKACEYQESRALLVLTYCAGGDLFELASEKRDLLTPLMVHRIFSELVHAVRYLHQNWIVHRDIKLENVLVNLPRHALQSLTEPLSHGAPIVTLTDLGLSRRIPQLPESPLLTTRCGSEDYAAPEILLGQPYDGRQTDAWALGVLLYALMEGRLPFDAPPGKPERSRNTHRIARCDWIWCRFGDDDGDWDPTRGAEFEGAQLCVEGLLKKVRMGRKPLEEIESMEWVRNGIQVPGGLKLSEGDGDDDALL